MINIVFVTDDNKFLINGEEFGPEDMEFDSVEDPPIDGEQQGDEMDDTAEDVARYGTQFISISPFIKHLIIFDKHPTSGAISVTGLIVFPILRTPD